jgi:hypothetical protein
MKDRRVSRKRARSAKAAAFKSLLQAKENKTSQPPVTGRLAGCGLVCPASVHPSGSCGAGLFIIR